MSDFTFEYTLLNRVIQITPKMIRGKKDLFVKNYEKNIFADNGLDFSPTEEYRIMEGKGVFRGIHFQDHMPQKSILSVISGEAYIVVVDLDKNSFQLGKYEIFFLNDDVQKSIFVPEWYGVATISLKNHTTISVINSGQYYEEFRAGICFNDATLNIKWPIENFEVTEKDRNLMTFKEYLNL